MLSRRVARLGIAKKTQKVFKVSKKEKVPQIITYEEVDVVIPQFKRIRKGLYEKLIEKSCVDQALVEKIQEDLTVVGLSSVVIHPGVARKLICWR